MTQLTENTKWNKEDTNLFNSGEWKGQIECNWRTDIRHNTETVRITSERLKLSIDVPCIAFLLIFYYLITCNTGG